MGPQPPSCHPPGGLKQTVLWKFSERKRLSQAFCLNSPPPVLSALASPTPTLCSPYFPFSFLFFSPLLLIFKRAELTALALSKANPGASQEQLVLLTQLSGGCPTRSLHVAVSGSRGRGAPREPHLPSPLPSSPELLYQAPAPRHPLPSRYEKPVEGDRVRGRKGQHLTKGCASLFSGGLRGPIPLVLCMKITCWHWRK